MQVGPHSCLPSCRTQTFWGSLPSGKVRFPTHSERTIQVRVCVTNGTSVSSSPLVPLMLAAGLLLPIQEWKSSSLNWPKRKDVQLLIFSIPTLKKLAYCHIVLKWSSTDKFHCPFCEFPLAPYCLTHKHACSFRIIRCLRKFPIWKTKTKTHSKNGVESNRIIV